MNRSQLDAWCHAQRLSAAATRTALTLTGARPSARDWRAFATTLLHAAGLGALGAGVIFFVAANWQALGVLGRFALLQAALVLAVGIAWWRPPPASAGTAALIVATLLTGALLALFGQSYQTGADVHELFFTWALLALPFALAGISGALWALWWSVLNVGLALLCGWVGTEHFFWRVLDGHGAGRAALLMLPCVVNLLAAGAFLALRSTRWHTAAPVWLVRALAAAGFVYGTAASISVVLDGMWRGGDHAMPEHGVAVITGFAAIAAAIGIATWRRKRDVFPMALIAASAIAVTTTWIARSLRFNDLGAFFLIAFWLVATSTAAGALLMHWSRRWPAASAPNGEGVVA
jgi:uncharacterized membrane protein